MTEKSGLLNGIFKIILFCSLFAVFLSLQESLMSLLIGWIKIVHSFLLVLLIIKEIMSDWLYIILNIFHEFLSPPIADVIGIIQHNLLHSTLPIFVVTDRWFFLAKVDVFTIIPNFDIKIFIVVRLQLKYQISCILGPWLTIECWSIFLSI